MLCNLISFEIFDVTIVDIQCSPPPFRRLFLDIASTDWQYLVDVDPSEAPPPTN
jgi:hypothetical protein